MLLVHRAVVRGKWANAHKGPAIIPSPQQSLLHGNPYSSTVPHTERSFPQSHMFLPVPTSFVCHTHIPQLLLYIPTHMCEYTLNSHSFSLPSSKPGFALLEFRDSSPTFCYVHCHPCRCLNIYAHFLSILVAFVLDLSCFILWDTEW